MPPRPVRVAIVNDYDIVVAGIAAVLRRYEDRIAVVELDSRMPVTSDVDVVLYDSFGQHQGEHMDVQGLVQGGEAKVVVFSWNTDDDLVSRAIKAGAVGYLHKGLDGDDLVSAIEAVHSGEQIVPRGAEEDDAFGRWPGDEHGLSARESEVLALICQGLSNQDIAERAFLGINTVKTYIRTAYRKIGVASRTQAVLWGMEHGFEPDRRRVVTGDHRGDQDS